MSSLIGKPLQGGKYKLESVLGRGGFGLTFRAHQTRLDTVVVVKTLNEDFWQAPNLSELQQQFQDEARRLAMCSHPNVVRVSDFFIEDGLPYMVMDYIPGRSLYDIVIPGNPLPVKAAVNYITQIGQALQAVHAKGLLHRDVKPQNIMIHAQSGAAILIDFGIARELSQNPAKTHTSIVSEGYAPIEQYLPKAHRSAATDIYGLAATLYTLLTAEIPKAAVLRDRDPLTPIRQLRPDVREPMAAAIAQGMNIELRDRPQSVGRWLTMLTQPATKTQRTTKTTAKRAPTTASPLSPSEYPTKVVAPAYTPDPTIHRSVGNRTVGNEQLKTVAVPLPTANNQNTAIQPTRVPAQSKKGFGCLSFLGLISLVIAGAFAASGFWLYQKLAESGIALPEFSLPEIALPTNERDAETQQENNASDSETSGDSASEEDTTPEAELDAKTTDLEAETALPFPETTTSQAALPLLLSNSGNPANAKPGDPGRPVPVPGFSPGTEEDKIRAQLGAPTREGSSNGFYTSAYTLVPNRVTLGYVYDQGSTRVRQSEAAFSPASDRLIMRSTLLGMLGNRPPADIVEGLEAVRTGARDRVSINTGNLTGAIERNANGYIHIYVQQ
ncbi:MAG: serine/threonine-protein kinase [Cyanobacteria bacterium P01_D01_bin.105]